jgi:GDPmannose 4,6-dehydratase
MAAAAISKGKQDCLYMGNIDARRDWGYAKDFVEGMWRMLQQDTPDDYVLATGEMHTVREFIEHTFKLVDMPISWEGAAEEEVGIDANSGKTIVRIDPQYYRPAEVEQLLGNPTKAKEKLGWEPAVKFENLVEIMLKADLADLS